MHAAEFKTLREAIGLTISTLVKVIDVDERTIRKWESGKKKLPAGVIESVVAIDQLLTDTANQMFSEIQQTPKDSVVLGRFIEEEDLLNAHPEFEGLPMSSHGVVLFRLRQKFIDAGVAVSIEYKEVAEYP
jgi:transcriptional regulator with XRE-family HTH domain